MATRYLAGLRSHLGRSRTRGVLVARKLGAEAAIAGGDTLALARIHESSMVKLAGDFDFAHANGRLLRLAGSFFSMVLEPTEKAHRTNREALSHLKAKAETLILHTAALSAGNRRLKKEVGRRKAAEEDIRKGKERYYRLFMQSQVMQKKLRSLARQILSAQEEERREISRELHDEVVQTLVGINVQLSALGRSSSMGLKAMKSNIAHTQRLVEKSVSAVHQFARELRPAVLDDLGLIPALHAFMKKLAVRKRIKIRLTAFAGVEKLSPDKRIVLYRVAQESLTNVGRHANAAIVTVNITPIPGAIRMEVHDDGKSFSVDKTLSKTNKRLGLLGMRERVEMVGGALNIDSAVGYGTTVRADIPFANISI